MSDCAAARDPVIDIAIVGGGAAGLTTAIMSARRLPRARVVVFDGASRLGAKILVSGGGRCNVTNRQVVAKVRMHYKAPTALHSVQHQ